VDETIFVDFKMNLINVNRIINADIIAGIDNSLENRYTFRVIRESKNVIPSTTGEKVILTRDKSKSQGIILYEELQEGIFDEINNIIDANQLLSKGKPQFMLGLPLYYRIYAERQHVNYNIEMFELLTKTGAMDFYAPFLFWMTRLPADRIVRILFEIYDQCKSPKINNLIKILILLGDEAIEVFSKLFESKYQRVIQKPDFYYTFYKLKKSKKENLILRVLNETRKSKLQLSQQPKDYSFGELVDNNHLSINQLSNECLNVFNGKISQRSVARDLDFLAYGNEMVINRSIIDELKKNSRIG
jgi:hypothetical protein